MTRSSWMLRTSADPAQSAGAERMEFLGEPAGYEFCYRPALGVTLGTASDSPIQVAVVGQLDLVRRRREQPVCQGGDGWTGSDPKPDAEGGDAGP